MKQGFSTKFTVTCLALVMVLTLLSACGGDNKPPTTAGTNQPLTFSFYANYDWMSFATKWGSDDVSKWIQDNKKVTINFINSNNAAKQKLNQMIASDDLPDVMMLDRGTDVERLINAQKLVALDTYLDKYPNLKKLAGEETLNLLRAKDGKLYQFPNWYIGDSTNGQYWTIINKKIHTELGSPKLETFADLESYLKLVKTRYPDITPLDMNDPTYMYPAFAENRSLANMGLFGYANGNKLSSIYEDPAFEESMAYTSKLFREKLISQDLFTHTADQVAEKLNTGKIAVYMGWDAAGMFPTANTKLKDTFSEPVYQTIWPIHKAGLNKDNIKPGYYTTLGWNVEVITKNAKDPEAIFAYLDWATSPEGQRVLSFGPKGLFWDETDNNGVPLPNKTYEDVDKSTLSSKHGLDTYNIVGNTTFVDHAKQTREKLLPPAQQNEVTIAQANIIFKVSTNTTEFSNLTPEPTSEEGVILQRLTDYNKQAVAKLVFAKDEGDFQNILNKVIEDVKNAKLDTLLQYETKRWQENVSAMKG